MRQGSFCDFFSALRSLRRCRVSSTAGVGGEWDADESEEDDEKDGDGDGDRGENRNAKGD